MTFFINRFPRKPLFLGNINQLNASDTELLKNISVVALVRDEEIESLSANDNALLQEITGAAFDVCTQILSYKAAYPQHIFIYATKSLQVNAKVAQLKENHYAIGLNIGCVFYMHQLTLLLFSKPAFMKKIGNINVPDNEAIHYVGKAYTHIPKCPVRIEYAGNVTILSTLIFFYHELAHILRGHVDYQLNMHLPELANEGVKREYLTVEIEKALECDADYHSGYFLGLTYTNDPQLFKSLFDADNCVDFFKSCTLAAKLAFHAFESLNPANNYHLPMTRLEVFLEGLTKSLDLEAVALENAVGVIIGIDNAFIKYGIDLGDEPEMIALDSKEFYAVTEALWGKLETELGREVR